MGPRRRAALGFVVDAVLVAVFVAIGRASHREDQSAFVVTLWPFGVGLLAGWAAGRGWRAPSAVVRTAVPAWLGTVAVGMLLRGVGGQGVQPAFVVVATIAVGVLLLGWRLLLRLARRSRGAGASRSAGSSLPR